MCSERSEKLQFQEVTTGITYISDSDSKLYKGQGKKDIIDYFCTSGDNFHWLDSEASYYFSTCSCRLLQTPAQNGVRGDVGGEDGDSGGGDILSPIQDPLLA